MAEEGGIRPASGVLGGYWMPAPEPLPPATRTLSVAPDERAALRRLRRGARSRIYKATFGGLRDRMSERRRRRLLDQLGSDDIRLVQLMVRLGL